MTEIEIQPRGTNERIVIVREPSPAVSINSDTATVGSNANSKSNVTKHILIIPDVKDRPRRKGVVITRSESPSSDKADAGQGDRWPSTRDAIRYTRRQSLRGSESGSQARTRTQSLSVDSSRRSGSKRRSRDTEAWIREQSVSARRTQSESQSEIQRGMQMLSCASTSIPLPAGWEVRFTNEQHPRIYFIDHIHRLSTWHDPRLQHRVP